MSSKIEVRAPSEQTEGTRSQVQRWLKAVGDSVAQNEPLLEVETDKVTIEIAAPAQGVLHEILKGEQEEIAPGELLGTIHVGAQAQGPAIESAAAATEAARPPAGSGAHAEDIATATLSAHALSAGRHSPAVRRLLAEHKLHASAISGTGGGGRITVDDVLAHLAKKGPAAARETAPAAEPVPGTRRMPHTSMRKRIAERMVESLLHTAPHVTTVFEADLGSVLAHRERHRADFERRGASLTLTAYFLAACVDAIRAYRLLWCLRM